MKTDLNHARFFNSIKHKQMTLNQLQLKSLSTFPTGKAAAETHISTPGWMAAL